MDLGTIQYNVDADTTGVDRANDVIEELSEVAKNAGVAVDGMSKVLTRGGNTAITTAASYDKIASSLKKQIDLYGNYSVKAELAYDIQSGAISGLTNAQKIHALSLAGSVDALNDGARAAAAFAESERQLTAAAAMAEREIAQQAAASKQLFSAVNSGLEREIALYNETSRAAKLSYEIQRGGLQSLSKEEKSLLLDQARRLDAMDNSNRALSGSTAQLSGGFRNLRGVSQNLGWQLQDVAVQAQMGTSAFTIFAQQGSQMASAFGPSGALIGAFIAVAGAVGGVLFSSLKTTGEAMDDMADNAKNLVKELEYLSAIQRQIVNDALGYSIEDEVTKRDALIASVNKHVISLQALNDQNGKIIEYATGERTYVREQIDNTDKIAAATKALAAERLGLVSIDKAIAELQDSTGATKRIRELAQEAELAGKVGKALYEAQAAQKGYSESQAIEYVSLSLYIDAQKESIKLDKNKAALAAKNSREEKALNAMFEKTINDRITAQKKLEAKEAARAKVAQNLIATLEKENELYGNQSKYVEVLYDIEHSLVKVTESEKARYLAAAKASDQAKVMGDEWNEALRLMEDFKDPFDNDWVSKIKDGETAVSNMFERIDQAASDMWVGMFDGFGGMMDGLQDLFKRTLAEMAHEAITKPIILNIQQGGNGIGALGAGLASPAGMISAGVIVGAALISEWNSSMDDKFEKMTAAYRQENQSIGTLLGSANEKSNSIGQSISQMEKYSSDVLGVNYQMSQTLLDIREGIGGVAAGFARQFGIKGTGDFSNISQGTSTNKNVMGAMTVGGISAANLLGDQVSGFIDGILDSVAKAIYNKKTKIIDTGVGFIGQSLVDILEGATVGAFSYAEVNTKTKVLGITTSNKNKTETQALDAVLLEQFGDVFRSAADAIEQVTPIFGKDFADVVGSMMIDATKLSLKGLEGDALVTEIEAFFSSTLDGWAGTLTNGSTILKDFQAVGEGAFETVMRLAGETSLFSDYAKTLNLDFNATGVAAIYASQSIADAAGGFDQLNSSMAGYYQNFFDDSERAERQTVLLSSALGEIGIDTVPSSREAFRSLAEGIDLTTEAGQQQFGALINLQGVFAELVPATEAASAALDKMALSLLDRSVQAEKKIIDDQIGVLNKALSASKSVFDALDATLNGLIISSGRTLAMSRRQAQGGIKQMLESARVGGLPNIVDITSALSVISQPSENLYSTFEDYAADFYRTASDIKALQDLAGDQVSTEEKALAELELQNYTLDSILEWSKAQVDIFNGVDVSIVSVADAIIGLSNVIGVSYPTMEQLEMLSKMTTSNSSDREQAYSAQEKTSASIVQQGSQMKEFGEYVKASQLAIADNTDKIRKLLDKFDVVGIPLREETITELAAAVAP